MDLLSQHEAFLRAIFDTPDDDTPRLVYADFLQENGDEDRAGFIRLWCEASRLPTDDPRQDHIDADLKALIRKHTSEPQVHPWPWKHWVIERGFPILDGPIPLYGSYIEQVEGLRWTVVRWTPEWYGSRSAKFHFQTRLGPEQVEIFLGLPFTQQVTSWDFSGEVEELAGRPGDGGSFGLIDMAQHPVVTTAGVEALSRHRAARRITVLDLRNNNLDNDAARALVKSPYLDDLKRLDLLEGNRFRGKVWQQVIERFGEDVVG